MLLFLFSKPGRAENRMDGCMSHPLLERQMWILKGSRPGKHPSALWQPLSTWSTQRILSNPQLYSPGYSLTQSSSTHLEYRAIHSWCWNTEWPTTANTLWIRSSSAPLQCQQHLKGNTETWLKTSPPERKKRRVWKATESQSEAVELDPDLGFLQRKYRI